MQVKTIIGIVILCLSLAASFVTSAAIQKPPEISAIAYVLYDADLDVIILEKNAHQRRSIASITKVMTLLYTIELIEQDKLALTDEIVCSARAQSREGTQINLRAGDVFSLEELLYATALASANDAAVAIAEHVAGSEAAFAKLMTERAHELGLTNSNYVDSSGLLSIFSDNYSTAFEQAMLMKIAMGHELFREIITTEEYLIKTQDKTIKNTHPLLGKLAGVEGGKTGATTPAGHTLTTSRYYDNRRLISVVLGAKSREVRNDESEKLINWAYGNLETIFPKDHVFATIEVPDGVDHQINAGLTYDFKVFVVEEADRQLEGKVEVVPNIKAPVDRGDTVGELVCLRQDGSEFSRVELEALQSTGLGSWLRRIYNRVLRFFQHLSN